MRTQKIAILKCNQPFVVSPERLVYSLQVRRQRIATLVVVPVVVAAAIRRRRRIAAYVETSTTSVAPCRVLRRVVGSSSNRDRGGIQTAVYLWCRRCGFGIITVFTITKRRTCTATNDDGQVVMVWRHEPFALCTAEVEPNVGRGQVVLPHEQ
jgi:hypothetical protein